MTYMKQLSLAFAVAFFGYCFVLIAPASSPQPPCVVVLSDVADLQHSDRLECVSEKEHGPHMLGVDEAHHVVFDFAVAAGGSERVVAGGGESEGEGLAGVRREGVVDGLCGGVESQPVHPLQGGSSGGAA